MNLDPNRAAAAAEIFARPLRRAFCLALATVLAAKYIEKVGFVAQDATAVRMARQFEKYLTEDGP